MIELPIYPIVNVMRIIGITDQMLIVLTAEIIVLFVQMPPLVKPVMRDTILLEVPVLYVLINS
jgi:hypothetical protein